MRYFAGDDERLSGNITLFLFFKPNHFKEIFMSNKKKKKEKGLEVVTSPFSGCQ